MRIGRARRSILSDSEIARHIFRHNCLVDNNSESQLRAPW